MRKASIIISICSMIAVSLTLLAQAPVPAPAGGDLSPVMKQVGPTNTALQAGFKDRSMSAADVAKNADKLQDLFGKVNVFMKEHKIDDATAWAADAAVAAGDLSKAAKANDFEAMKVSAAKVAKACGTCHAAHREQLPDKTFKLKTK